MQYSTSERRIICFFIGRLSSEGSPTHSINASEMSDYEDLSVVQVDESDLQSVGFFESLTDRFGGDYVSAHDKNRIVLFLNKRLLSAQGYASEGSEYEDLPVKKVCLEVDESDVASTASSSDAASVYVPSEDDEATKTEFLAQKDLQLQSVCDVLSKRGLIVYLVDHYGGSLVPIHAATIRTRVSIFTISTV